MRTNAILTIPRKARMQRSGREAAELVRRLARNAAMGPQIQASMNEGGSNRSWNVAGWNLPRIDRRHRRFVESVLMADVFIQQCYVVETTLQCVQAPWNYVDNASSP